MSDKVILYKFANALDVARRIGGAHFVFFIILLLWMPRFGWMVEGRTIICIISAISAIMLPRLLDMKRPANVGIVILMYMMLVAAEFFTIGIPEPLIDIDHRLSKGIMFEMLIGIIPMVYSGLRLFIVLPMVTLLIWSRKLSHLHLS